MHVIDIEDGRFARTSRQDLRSVFDEIGSSSGSGNLVLHFHGGLVDREAGMRTATRLEGVYDQGGAYSVFVVWNSGLVTTFTKNWRQIGQEKVFRRIVRRIAQFVGGKLMESLSARGGGVELDALRDVPDDGPELDEYLRKIEARSRREFSSSLGGAQEQQLEQLLGSDGVLKSEAAAIAASLTDDRGTRGTDEVSVGRVSTLLSEDIQEELRGEGGEPGERGATAIWVLARHGIPIAKRVIERCFKRRDHGVYTTIVEETLRELYVDHLGSLAWELMKGDTMDAFGPNPDLHAGTALLQELHRTADPGRRITLVGHSTGAIFIGHFLEHADELLPADIRFDVVLLAPASTFAFQHERLDLYRRRVSGLRVFNLSDELEQGYFEVPLLYRGSLLYMVSGLFEGGGEYRSHLGDTPLLGMQRYFSAKPPYDQREINEVVQYLNSSEVMVWSKSELTAGRMTTAEKHGEFDEDGPTLRSLAHILVEGLGG